MQDDRDLDCLLQMVTDLLLERGDSILCESFTYFYLVDSVLPIKGYNAVPMDMDDYGICPLKLKQVTLPLTRHPISFLSPLYLFSVCNAAGSKSNAIACQA